jgi:hypothetical protein
MALMKNPFEGFLSSKLLLPIFTTMNPIFGLELTRKTCFPILKSLMADVFLQGHYIVHLFSNELEVRDYGSVELECFIFKLQKLKLVILDRMWRENGEWKVKQEDLKYNLVQKCCFVQPFVKQSV